MSEQTDQKRTLDRFNALMRGEGLSNSVLPKLTETQMRQYIKRLQVDLKDARKSFLSDQIVKNEIIGLGKIEPEIPSWVLMPSKKPTRGPGVPTLFCSDWHYGEVVRPDEINGKNSYNIQIANRRIQSLVASTVKLLKNHITNPEYPGIILALGGDMLSGDIHEELSETNEEPMMKILMALYGKMIWVIDNLRAEFGRVFIPVVAGNHGRTSRKPRAKRRAHTNYDWLLGALLQKHYEGDKNVVVMVSEGPDLRYSVYGYRYLLTHGDQFRGGDGITGALMPIVRGDHKKRSRNAQIDMDYDTMLMGHWHQFFHTPRIIVNSSLKGLDEYAYQCNFPYEPPSQSLWITNAKRGITFMLPVMVDRDTKKAPTNDWVAWEK